MYSCYWGEFLRPVTVHEVTLKFKFTGYVIYPHAT